MSKNSGSRTTSTLRVALVSPVCATLLLAASPVRAQEPTPQSSALQPQGAPVPPPSPPTAGPVALPPPAEPAALPPPAASGPAEPTPASATSAPATPPLVQQTPPGEEVIPARTGFQIAFRTGLAMPLGKVSSGVDMLDNFGVQVPLWVDIGAKVTPHVFFGGYLGLGLGGVPDCSQRSCVSVSARLGLQVQYHFRPDAKINPWLGYGLGLEGLGASRGTNRDNGTTTAFGGYEFAHFMAGLDLRLKSGSTAFGIGPVLDFAAGTYVRASTEVTTNGYSFKTESSIDNTAIHGWGTLGVKFTVFP